MPRNWPKVEELYHAALERPAAEREAFVSAACGGDDELRREVQSLLKHEREAERLMEEPALGAATQKLAVVRGRRLGPYEVTDLVGAGGMGEVYRARDTRLGRDVAIKVLPEHVAHDPDALARFGREARAVAALSHPHIAALFDIGETDGTHYLVMELLEGETLAARLGRGVLPEKDALRIGAEIAEALGAAHAHGIVHRDVKPANVMLTRAPRAVGQRARRGGTPLRLLRGAAASSWSSSQRSPLPSPRGASSTTLSRPTISSRSDAVSWTGPASLRTARRSSTAPDGRARPPRSSLPGWTSPKPRPSLSPRTPRSTRCMVERRSSTIWTGG